MRHHWHLLVRQRTADALPRFMRWLALATAGAGSRFMPAAARAPSTRARYRSVAVEDDAHLLTVLRYIERNPVRAGLVRSAAGRAWSSLAERLGGGGDLLAPLPLPLLPGWPALVDRPQTPAEEAAARGRPDAIPPARKPLVEAAGRAGSARAGAPSPGGRGAWRPPGAGRSRARSRGGWPTAGRQRHARRRRHAGPSLAACPGWSGASPSCGGRAIRPAVARWRAGPAGQALPERCRHPPTPPGPGRPSARKAPSGTIDPPFIMPDTGGPRYGVPPTGGGQGKTGGHGRRTASLGREGTASATETIATAHVTPAGTRPGADDVFRSTARRSSLAYRACRATPGSRRAAPPGTRPGSQPDLAIDPCSGNQVRMGATRSRQVPDTTSALTGRQSCLVTLTRAPRRPGRMVGSPAPRHGIYSLNRLSSYHPSSSPARPPCPRRSTSRPIPPSRTRRR